MTSIRNRRLLGAAITLHKTVVFRLVLALQMLTIMRTKRRPMTKGGGRNGAAAQPKGATVGDAPRDGVHESHIENWDEYFLELARTVARKSKDPRCPVGAVIVSPDSLVIATGFNGLARGVDDDKELLANVDEKLRWICHAEENAILNAGRTGASVRDCTIYVTKFPCFSCCNEIAQGGVTRIFTDDDRFWDDDPLDGLRNLDGTMNPEPHRRKRVLFRQLPNIRVVAENHPEYTTRWRPPTEPANGADGSMSPPPAATGRKHVGRKPPTKAPHRIQV